MGIRIGLVKSVPMPQCSCKNGKDDPCGLGAMVAGDSFLLPVTGRDERKQVVEKMRLAQEMGYKFIYDKDTNEDRLWLVRKVTEKCDICGEDLSFATAAE